jgi:type IV pilus assembly protein PilE
MLNKQSKKVFGFTIVELMIVLAIVAILAALALPNYTASVRKSRRAAAQTDLLEFAGTAERIFTQTNSYLSTDADTDGTPNEVIVDTDFYTYTFSAGPTATTWTIQAAPKTGQDEDPCGTMTLNQTGARAGAVTGCF